MKKFKVLFIRNYGGLAQLARASRIAAGESTVRILLGKGFSLQILKKFKVLFIRNYGGLAQLARASRI
uniref:hypothetical protein n=1 Tax=Algoriphagus sp. TaxID=1872435 RepID=UPI004048CD65